MPSDSLDNSKPRISHEIIQTSVELSKTSPSLMKSSPSSPLMKMFHDSRLMKRSVDSSIESYVAQDLGLESSGPTRGQLALSITNSALVLRQKLLTALIRRGQERLLNGSSDQYLHSIG